MQHLDNAFLVTMDVTALYTNVDHANGLQALRYLQQRPKPSPPTDFIVELTDWTLKNIYFLISTMGAAYAPNYAGLYLGLWEKGMFTA